MRTICSRQFLSLNNEDNSCASTHRPARVQFLSQSRMFQGLILRPGWESQQTNLITSLGCTKTLRRVFRIPVTGEREPGGEEQHVIFLNSSLLLAAVVRNSPSESSKPILIHRYSSFSTKSLDAERKVERERMSSSQRQQQRSTRISPLVEAMVSGERAGVGGVLVNDLNGLCLLSKGDMSTTTTAESVTDGDNSGVYTSLVRLASTLSPNEKSPSPLITIEMEGPASILIKEYDGHTVAMKVRNMTKENNEPAN